MIYMDIKHYVDSKETAEELIKLLDKTVNNYCVEHSLGYVIHHNVTVVAIPTKVIE